MSMSVRIRVAEPVDLTFTSEIAPDIPDTTQVDG